MPVSGFHMHAQANTHMQILHTHTHKHARAPTHVHTHMHAQASTHIQILHTHMHTRGGDLRVGGNTERSAPPRAVYLCVCESACV